MVDRRMEIRFCLALCGAGRSSENGGSQSTRTEARRQRSGSRRGEVGCSFLGVVLIFSSMSTSEILAELPKLPPAELELIYSRAAELQLQAVLDEADAAFEEDGGVSLADARRIVDSWTTK